MTLLLSPVVVLLGIYTSMHILAALHRIIDVWYAIGREWPRVAASLLAWTTVTLVVPIVLPSALRQVFLWSFAGYFLFYIVMALYLSRVVVARIAARIGTE